jgi:hypothetical protein
MFVKLQSAKSRKLSCSRNLVRITSSQAGSWCRSFPLPALPTASVAKEITFLTLLRPRVMGDNGTNSCYIKQQNNQRSANIFLIRL